MDFNELCTKHADETLSVEHGEVSIRFAISVLEELRDYLMSIYHHNSADHTENKIEELKKLLS